VYAPAAAIVEDELVRVGEMVAVGTPIVRLRRRDDVTLKVYLPIADAQQVRPGMEAQAYLEGLANRVTGSVARVASEAEFTPKDIHVPEDRATLVFAVELRFPNPDGILKDGFPADAYIRWDPAVPWPAERPWR
jgi:HlyD family secretion protein